MVWMECPECSARSNLPTRALVREPRMASCWQSSSRVRWWICLGCDQFVGARSIRLARIRRVLTAISRAVRNLAPSPLPAAARGGPEYRAFVSWQCLATIWWVW